MDMSYFDGSGNKSFRIAVSSLKLVFRILILILIILLIVLKKSLIFMNKKASG